jgi:MFS family permease
MTTVPAEATKLSELTEQQKKSGLAAWLGWFFDGLDLHLYTLVATVFVAQLLGTETTDPDVRKYGAFIMGAFLLGWAMGGAVFGYIGDRLGRSRTLVLTVLTYALFTGLAFFAQNWWQLLIFRFLAALGIGGEWAIGASLLSETWPKKWRPWIAAVLQCAVNFGILAAILSVALMGYFVDLDKQPKWVFLIGVLPAFVTLWIRHAVPETDEWKAEAGRRQVPPLSDLFAPGIRRSTWLAVAICAISLTGHWIFMYWQQAFIKMHPGVTAATQGGIIKWALFTVIACSVLGNFASGWAAHRFGYGRALCGFFGAYFLLMAVAFFFSWSLPMTFVFYGAIGFCQGVFGLFTMCLPPLFPTLQRTTGAGFSYNVGRVFSAIGVVVFGLVSIEIGQCLLYASFLFIPAAILALWLPQPE